MLKNLILLLSVSTMLLGGCVQYKDGKCVKNCDEAKPTTEEKKDHKEFTAEEDIKNAQKAFKAIGVKEITDARDVNDHITVQLVFSEDMGYYTQASGAVGNTDKFINTLHNKPKTVTTTIVNEAGTKLVQFSVDTEKDIRTLEFAHKDLKKLLNKTGYFASHK